MNLSQYVVCCLSGKEFQTLLELTHNNSLDINLWYQFKDPLCCRVTDGEIDALASLDNFYNQGYSVISLDDYLSLQSDNPMVVKPLSEGMLVHCNTQEEWARLQFAVKRDGIGDYRYFYSLSDCFYVNVSSKSEFSHHYFFDKEKDTPPEGLIEFSDLLIPLEEYLQMTAQQNAVLK